MSLSGFYREQAMQQRTAADDATLENVRTRCNRAADAWVELAVRSERAEAARLARLPVTEAASDLAIDRADNGGETA